MTNWEQTDLALDAPDLAQRLWEDGFRPVAAATLRPGMTVAYVATFLGASSGDVQTATVEHVAWTDDLTVTVRHTGGETESDDDAEVWAKC